MSAPITRNWQIRGPSKRTLDTPEGGDYAIVVDGQVIGEAFARSSTTHTWPAREHALVMAAGPELLEHARKSADTFAELARTFRLFGYPTAAEACEVAERATHEVIAKAEGKS